MSTLLDCQDILIVAKADSDKVMDFAEIKDMAPWHVVS